MTEKLLQGWNQRKFFGRWKKKHQNAEEYHHSLQDAEREFVRGEPSERATSLRRRHGEGGRASTLITSSTRQYALQRIQEPDGQPEGAPAARDRPFLHELLHSQAPRICAARHTQARQEHPSGGGRQYKAGQKRSRWSERNRSFAGPEAGEGRLHGRQRRSAVDRRFRRHYADRDGKAAQYAGLISTSTRKTSEAERGNQGRAAAERRPT